MDSNAVFVWVVYAATYAVLLGYPLYLYFRYRRAR